MSHFRLEFGASHLCAQRTCERAHVPRQVQWRGRARGHAPRCHRVCARRAGASGRSRWNTCPPGRTGPAASQHRCTCASNVLGVCTVRADCICSLFASQGAQQYVQLISRICKISQCFQIHFVPRLCLQQGNKLRILQPCRHLIIEKLSAHQQALCARRMVPQAAEPGGERMQEGGT